MNGVIVFSTCELSVLLLLLVLAAATDSLSRDNETTVEIDEDVRKLTESSGLQNDFNINNTKVQSNSSPDDTQESRSSFDSWHNNDDETDPLEAEFDMSQKSPKRVYSWNFSFKNSIPTLRRSFTNNSALDEYFQTEDRFNEYKKSFKIIDLDKERENSTIHKLMNSIGRGLHRVRNHFSRKIAQWRFIARLLMLKRKQNRKLWRLKHPKNVTDIFPSYSLTSWGDYGTANFVPHYNSSIEFACDDTLRPVCGINLDKKIMIFASKCKMDYYNYKYHTNYTELGVLKCIGQRIRHPEMFIYPKKTVTAAVR